MPKNYQFPKSNHFQAFRKWPKCITGTDFSASNQQGVPNDGLYELKPNHDIQNRIIFPLKFRLIPIKRHHHLFKKCLHHTFQQSHRDTDGRWNGSSSRPALKANSLATMASVSQWSKGKFEHSNQSINQSIKVWPNIKLSWRIRWGRLQALIHEGGQSLVRFLNWLYWLK